MRTIQYGITADGNFVSRVDSEIAWPVLDFEGIKPENGYALKYNLQKFPIHTVSREWDTITWTKKIERDIKNVHRKFWGMKPLSS